MGNRWLSWILAFVIAVMPLGILGWQHWQRPPRLPLDRPLFQGIQYHREARSQPRPLMIHIVQIDLTEPSLQVQVTPGQPIGASADRAVGDRTEISARTTQEFLQEFGLSLAINANFFYHFREETPWGFYPHSGDRVHVVGEAIANGQPYSEAEATWPVLCFDATNRAHIAPSTCPPQTQHGVAGSHLLLAHGQPMPLNPSGMDRAAYGRTVVALDAAGETLWLLAIDDKQPRYSEGMTLAEVTDLLMELGVDAAINLDGGGSTTLVLATPQGSKPLNAPIHTKIPMRERPIANHLGFKAAPLVELGKTS